MARWFLTALNDGNSSESNKYSGMELDIWNNGYCCGMKQKELKTMIVKMKIMLFVHIVDANIVQENCQWNMILTFTKKK